MRKRRLKILTLASSMMLLLACEQQLTPNALADQPPGSEERVEEQVSRDLIEDQEAVTDLEAPELFQKNALGLWDGRPSFGGIWIAHPDVVEPQRVVIRNENAGTSVTGALFQRTRLDSSPPFQVSAEAAEALEMIPGQPVQLSVTALRRKAVSEAN